MRITMKLPAVIAFESLIVLGAGLFPAGARIGMTTGELGVHLARATGISLPDADPQRAAMMSLRKAGIDLGRDPGATATQADLLQAGRALLVRVVGARAEAPVTAVMGSAFIRSYAGEARSATDAAPASCQGRESRAGREGSPAGPADPSATAPPSDPEP
jgi:hypothetical protein